MYSKEAYMETQDPIEKVTILMSVFGIEGLQRMGISIDEEYVETLDVFTAFDFIDFYEDYIVRNW